MPGDLSEDQVREALKEAFREWLDARYAEVGRWTVGAFFLGVFGGLVWIAMTTAGWHR
jgi:hypothetical protein